MNVAELPAGVEIDTLCAFPLTVTVIVPSTLYSSLKKLPVNWFPPTYVSRADCSTLPEALAHRALRAPGQAPPSA